MEIIGRMIRRTALLPESLVRVSLVRRSIHAKLPPPTLPPRGPVTGRQLSINNKRQDLSYKREDFTFRQLFDARSSTYTYILGDVESKEAIIIDPVFEMVERDFNLLRDLNLNLIFAVNTHVHADHITGTGVLKKRFNNCRSVLFEPTAAADRHVVDGERIEFGKFHVETRNTPGHTNGCVTYVWKEKGMAFTGDALLIRGCGRTDFQDGSPSKLYASVHSKILSLPDHFLLYPAHDYTGRTVTTVDEEKRLNPRLTKTLEEFTKIMNELNLPPPKYINESVPANMVCGLFETKEDAKRI